MALVLAFTETENSPSANDITIADSTGLYDANNTGGYGTPNPDRADLKLFIKTFHVNSSLVETLLTPENYTTTTATEFTYTDISDGWKKHFLIGIDITGGVPTDEDVNAYLDAMTSTQLAALTNGQSVTINSVSYTLYITALETFPAPQAKIDKWELNERYNQSCLTCTEERAEKGTNFRTVWYLWMGANYDFQRGNKLQAQKDIERCNQIGQRLLYAES